MDVFAQEVIKKFLSTPKSRQDLLRLTGLADRTLRYNISILKKKKLVIEYKNLKDMRKKMYLLVNV
ncbi:MAG: hypothetical protein QXD55_01195 [Candidatus Aenigmatarchaeota archaeon]